MFKKPHKTLPRKPTTTPQIHPEKLSNKTDSIAIPQPIIFHQNQPIISLQSGGLSKRIWPSDSLIELPKLVQCFR